MPKKDDSTKHIEIDPDSIFNGTPRDARSYRPFFRTRPHSKEYEEHQAKVKTLARVLGKYANDHKYSWEEISKLLSSIMLYPHLYMTELSDVNDGKEGNARKQG